MLAIVIGFGFAVFGASSIKAGASALGGAIPLGLFKKNKELKRNMKLGVNSEYKNHKNETFELFQFEKESLPEQMHWLTDVKFVLTEKELFLLFSMVRRQMMDEQYGPFFEETMTLCRAHGIDYGTLTNHARMLGGKIDYEELIWLSKNRLDDSTLQQKLLGKG